MLKVSCEGSRIKTIVKCRNYPGFLYLVSVYTCFQAGFRDGASGDYEFSFKMGFDFGFKQGLQYGLHRGGIKGTTMWVYCCISTCYFVYGVYESACMCSCGIRKYNNCTCGVDYGQLSSHHCV